MPPSYTASDVEDHDPRFFRSRAAVCRGYRTVTSRECQNWGLGCAKLPPMPLTRSRLLLPARRDVPKHLVFDPTREPGRRSCHCFFRPKPASAAS
jgi:hypothetical protein